MRKTKEFVFMIDYHFESDGYCDQCECDNKEDLFVQLKYLLNDGATIDNVKLVNVNERYWEEDVSYTIGVKVIKMCGYKPFFMHHRKKGEKI